MLFDPDPISRVGVLQGWKGLRAAAVQLIPVMEGFRACIIGLALVGIGAAWVWHLPVLLVLALAIGGGETFAASRMLCALRRGVDLACSQSRARDRTHPMPVRCALTAWGASVCTPWRPGLYTISTPTPIFYVANLVTRPSERLTHHSQSAYIRQMYNCYNSYCKVI
jgi:hypothetical protein